MAEKKTITCSSIILQKTLMLPMYDSRYGGFLNGNLKQEHLFSPSETTRLSKIVFLVYTRLPQTKIAPENGWLEDEFPFGMVETCVYDYDSDWFSSPEMDSQCKRILLVYHILGFRYLYVDLLYCNILYTYIWYISSCIYQARFSYKTEQVKWYETSKTSLYHTFQRQPGRM